MVGNRLSAIVADKMSSESSSRGDYKGEKITEKELRRRFGGLQAREQVLEKMENKVKEEEKKVQEKANSLHNWHGALQHQKETLDVIAERLRPP